MHTSFLFLLLNPNADRNPHGAIADAVVVKKILRHIPAGRNASQQRSRHLLGIVLQLLSGTPHTLQTITFADFLEASSSGVASSYLRSQIALTLLGSADICKHHL